MLNKETSNRITRGKAVRPFYKNKKKINLLIQDNTLNSFLTEINAHLTINLCMAMHNIIFNNNVILCCGAPDQDDCLYNKGNI